MNEAFVLILLSVQYDFKTANAYLEMDLILRATTMTSAQLRIVPFTRAQDELDATISCEDNLKFMRRLDDESMNLIVTSPPYNLGKEYEEKRSQERYIEEQVACIAEAVRLLHPNGSICWQVGNHVQNGEIFPLDIILYPIFKNAGLQLRNRIVWTFGHGLHCQKRFSGRHETILWFTKTEDYTFNLDPVRVPSKYQEKKHFNGPKKGTISSNPIDKDSADVRQPVQQHWEACLFSN